MSKFEHGYQELIDPGSDTPILRSGTTQCVHCGGHFEIGPGKTKGRGFCFRCNGHICGAACLECVPEEAMLEILEGTRNPTAVSVGSSIIMPGSFSPGG